MAGAQYSAPIKKKKKKKKKEASIGTFKKGINKNGFHYVEINL